MRTLLRASMLAAFLTALALGTGCEDTPLFAGKDFKMTLVAEPGDVVNGKPTWNIVVTVVNDTNIPQQGITVDFSASTGGSLLHGSAGVTTHSDGRAVDLLTVEPDAPASITVTATSAALTKTVTITTTGGGICDINTFPTAAVVPSTPQTLPGGTVGTSHDLLLDGTSSTDLQTASASLIYLWDCGNDTAPTVTETGKATCKYTNQSGSEAQPFVVTLKVTDLGLVGHETDCAKSDSVSVNVTVPAGT